MLTRLKDWRLARQERKREQVRRDYGSLSEEEQEELRRPDLKRQHEGHLPTSGGFIDEQSPWHKDVR